MTLRKTILAFLLPVISTACSSVGDYTCRLKLEGSNLSTDIPEEVYTGVTKEIATQSCDDYATQRSSSTGFPYRTVLIRK